MSEEFWTLRYVRWHAHGELDHFVSEEEARSAALGMIDSGDASPGNIVRPNGTEITPDEYMKEYE